MPWCVCAEQNAYGSDIGWQDWKLRVISQPLSFLFPTVIRGRFFTLVLESDGRLYLLGLRSTNQKVPT